MGSDVRWAPTINFRSHNSTWSLTPSYTLYASGDMAADGERDKSLWWGCEMRDCSQMEKLLQIQREATGSRPWSGKGRGGEKEGRGGPPWGSPTWVPTFHSDPHWEDSLLVTQANSEPCREVWDPSIFSSVTWEGENLLRKWDKISKHISPGRKNPWIGQEGYFPSSQPDKHRVYASFCS